MKNNPIAQGIAIGVLLALILIWIVALIECSTTHIVNNY